MGRAPGSRHVLVTGAAGGIGRAVAEAFAGDAGTGLTLVDVDPGGLAAAASALDAGQVCVDLADTRGPGEAVRRAWDSRGGIDVLVNAAGIYPSLDMIDVDADVDADWDLDGAADRETEADLDGARQESPATRAEAAGAGLWDRIFALNTRAPALATAALARRAVAASRPASVVSISSGAALRARPGGGPYAASKAALEMATRAAALELGPHGIRVNAVSPGFVPVGSGCNPVAPRYAAAVSANPLGRPGTPRDIALAVRWIAGEEAAWITGEILRVDGGSGTGAGHLPRLWPPEPPEPAHATHDETEGSTV
ncbi:short-chain dehydrogenase [Streptomyces abyssalis]|uniref:Short-chain dehydrogenase n=1 Tax=Streptomyces abyssalis TaxID=933944 RepID=A0A1E7JKT9_9ACTN|nr:SDR family oxidoreductase [Streptomyces abyssalis]OEU88242.1 short-chain dehydrogenase [Streptomyces abyssalis]OEU91113.1 short-chain dehydrogenase [Streptomyces abyssalis]